MSLSGGSRIFSLWVDWLPVSPNELLHAHWTVVGRNNRAAQMAWSGSLLFSSAGREFSTMTTQLRHSSPCGTPSPEPLASTMGTSGSGSSTRKPRRRAGKASL